MNFIIFILVIIVLFSVVENHKQILKIKKHLGIKDKETKTDES